MNRLEFPDFNKLSPAEKDAEVAKLNALAHIELYEPILQPVADMRDEGGPLLLQTNIAVSTLKANGAKIVTTFRECRYEDGHPTSVTCITFMNHPEFYNGGSVLLETSAIHCPGCARQRHAEWVMTVAQNTDAKITARIGDPPVETELERHAPVATEELEEFSGDEKERDADYKRFVRAAEKNEGRTLH